MPRGGLPRNSVDRITDRHDMTSAVDRGRKALAQLNNNKQGDVTYNRNQELLNFARYSFREISIVDTISMFAKILVNPIVYFTFGPLRSAEIF